MTSLHMLPADDPASVESFLRVRKSRLVVGPYRVRPEKRYDADRLLHDLASIRRAAEASGCWPRGWRTRRRARQAAAVGVDRRASRPGGKRRPGRPASPGASPASSTVTAGAGVLATRSCP